MPTNKELLALYGIELLKESKTSSLIKLYNKPVDSRLSKALYEKLISAIDHRKFKQVFLPKITFGIELEFVGSRISKDVNIFNAKMIELLGDKYFYAGTYTHNDGKSWVLGRDGSIYYENTRIVLPFGYELSTPKLDLFNDNDIRILSTVIGYIKKYLKGEINHTCGTHVHIGFDKPKTFRASILDLLNAYSFMEKTVFDPIVPSSRRRNKYCKPTKPRLREKYQKLSSRFCEFMYDGESTTLHFEFRQLEGTLELQTILYWAKLQAYVLYDLLDHLEDDEYIHELIHLNIFQVLCRYDFDIPLINFFIDRTIEFKSRSIQQA